MSLARPGRHAALRRAAGGREGAAHHAGARRSKPRGDGGAGQGALTGVRQGGDAGLPPFLSPPAGRTAALRLPRPSPESGDAGRPQHGAAMR